MKSVTADSANAAFIEGEKCWYCEKSARIKSFFFFLK